MILVDKPFVSSFLKTTIKENRLPIVQTEVATQLGVTGMPSSLTEEAAIQQAKQSANPPLYTNSENSIGWIAQHLPFSTLPQKIELFKDKVKFRNLVSAMYPDFYFREVQMDKLDDLSIENIPTPFIIKPAVGFFSMGVYKVTDRADWEQTKALLNAEIRNVQDLYPTEVLDTTSFIIEQCIEGDEFAFDAYFDADGEPVILNIYKHLFSSSEDVSDRIYTTSKEIVETNLDQFTALLQEIGKLSGLKNFPVHVELRRDQAGVVLPIEVNPMRFGGWCTTADMTYFAYGFNPYLLYFSQERPDWAQILEGKEGKLYSIIVLDNSTGVDGHEIETFDYDRLISLFDKPLELRKLDYTEYPVFGFLFAETKEARFSELEYILTSDLREFVTTRA